VLNKITKLSLLLIVIFIIAFACSNKPSDVGGILIPKKDKIIFKEIDSYKNSFNQTFSTFEKDSLFFGNSKRVLLGSYKNLSVDMLLSFGILLQDSIAKDIEANQVKLISSWIEMHPNYWIGDKSHFEFTVKEINYNWSSNDFNNDTLEAVKSSLSSDILIKNTYSFSDSLIKFGIKNEVVNNWITNIANKSVSHINGLYFSPVSKTGIAGFQAISRFITSKYITLNMVFQKEGKWIDTIKAVQSLDLHVVSRTLPQQNANSLILQGSSLIRGKLWFDVSQIPDNVILNRATLDLFIDKSATEIGTVRTDTVAVRFFINKNENLINNTYGIAALYKKGDKYSGDIRKFVQRWVNGENNEGMEVRLGDEDRSANTIAFYRSDYKVDSLKPRLTILYTISNKND